VHFQGHFGKQKKKETSIPLLLLIISTLWTLLGDMSQLTASIARLGSPLSTPFPTDPGWAVSGNVAKLAATVALGRIRLAVSGEVIIPATVVAHDSGAGSAATVESATSTATVSTATTLLQAVASQMSWTTASVAS